MRIGLICLVLGYVLSQFYRAFLAVLTPALSADLGATAADLSNALAIWFLIFAAMQIPVGEALDRVGPRLTTAVLFALGGGGGALMFSVAQTPVHIYWAMALIGVGCSPVLMASYYIFAKMYPAAMFATLAGAVIGFGSLGNLASSAPMALVAETFGWRPAMIGLAVVTTLIAVAIGVFVKDPPRAEGPRKKGSVLDILRMPVLWLIFPMMLVNYTAAAGIRGVWAGPYLSDTYGMDSSGIGTATLIMGLAMIAGNFLYGPAERLFGSRKWVVWGGNAFCALCCYALWLIGPQGFWATAALFALIGFFGASFPVLVAHGRAFFPDHLVGRGVTLMNLFGIGGVALSQFGASRLFERFSGDANAGYSAVFLAYAVLMTCGLVVYLFAQDRTD